MAVIRERTSARPRQRTQRRRPQGELTESQRAMLDAQRRAHEETLEAQKDAQTTAIILRSIGMAVDVGLKAWDVSRDPPQIRAEKARQGALQDEVSAFREQVAQDRMGAADAALAGPIPGPTPTPSPGNWTTGPMQNIYKEVDPAGAARGASGPGAAPATEGLVPAGAQPPQAAPAKRPAIRMTTGDVQQFRESWPNFAGMAGNQEAMQKFANDTGFKLADVQQSVAQGTYLHRNMDAMLESGALIATEGEPTGVWKALGDAAVAPAKSTWGPGRAAGQAYQSFEGVGAGAGATGGGGSPFVLFEQLAQVRDTRGDDAMIRVAEQVAANPQAGRRLVEEAQRANPDAPVDWRAALRGVEENNPSAVIAALGPVLTGEYKGTPKGLTEAQTRFGESGRAGEVSTGFYYPEPGSYTIQEVRDAYTALKAAGDPRAQRLLDDRILAGAAGVESVPGLKPYGGREAMVGQMRLFVGGGEPEYAGGGLKQAVALHGMAAKGRELELKGKREETRARGVELKGLRSRKETRGSVSNIVRNLRTPKEQKAGHAEIMELDWVKSMIEGLGDRPGVSRTEVERLAWKSVRSNGRDRSLEDLYGKMRNTHLKDLREARSAETAGRSKRGELRTVGDRVAKAQKKVNELGPEVTAKDLRADWETKHQGTLALDTRANAHRAPGALDAYYKKLADAHNKNVRAAQKALKQAQDERGRLTN